MSALDLILDHPAVGEHIRTQAADPLAKEIFVGMMVRNSELEPQELAVIAFNAANAFHAEASIRWEDRVKALKGNKQG